MRKYLKNTLQFAVFVLVFVSGYNTIYAYDNNVNFAPRILKTDDSSIKAYLANSRAQAELYYDGNGNSYKDLCKTPQSEGGIKETLNILKKDFKTKADCDSNQDQYAIEAKLKNEKGYFCVDSTGVAVFQNKTKGKSAFSCQKQKKTEKVNQHAGELVNTKDQTGLLFQNIKGLKESYSIGETVQFSVELTHKNKTYINPKDDSFVIEAQIQKIDETTGSVAGVSSIDYEPNWGTYDKKKKVWKLEALIDTVFSEAYPGPGSWWLWMVAKCTEEEDTKCHKTFGENFFHSARQEIQVK